MTTERPTKRGTPRERFNPLRDATSAANEDTTLDGESYGPSVLGAVLAYGEAHEDIAGTPEYAAVRKLATEIDGGRGTGQMYAELRQWMAAVRALARPARAVDQPGKPNILNRLPGAS